MGLASGVILGALIMYYLLKDGGRFRRSVVAQFDPTFRDGIDSFLGDSNRTLRDYGRARTVMSVGANLVLENFVEPKVMGRSLKIHPLIVLVVTALGGLIGGIVGLILAVPAAVVPCHNNAEPPSMSPAPA